MTRAKKTLLSLVICTYNRHRELLEVLRSLGDVPEEVEILLVDQNPVPIDLGMQTSKITTIIRKDLGSLSEGRKVGIRRAKGVFIGIPDDDNYYKEGFLKQMLGTLERHRKDTMMVGAIANWEVFKYFPRSEQLSSWQALSFGNSGTIVLRKETIEMMKDYGLEMDMSPGTKFPAGDETMLIANTLSQNKRYYFVGVKDAYINHPVFPISKEREMVYGLGMGGLAAKLMLKPWLPGWKLAARLMIGPFIQVIVCALRGERKRAEIAYTKMIKRWEGYVKMAWKEVRATR